MAFRAPTITITPSNHNTTLPTASFRRSIPAARRSEPVGPDPDECISDGEEGEWHGAAGPGRRARDVREPILQRSANGGGPHEGVPSRWHVPGRTAVGARGRQRSIPS